MPLYSQKQRRFFGAELGRAKKGQHTKTGLSVDKLTELVESGVSKKKKKRKRNFLTER